MYIYIYSLGHFDGSPGRPPSLDPQQFVVRRQVPSNMSAEKKQAESEEGVHKPPLEEDPAFFLHFYCDRLHTALSLPNAPYRQQTTPRQSVTVFQRYVYDLMLGAGPCEEDNGVVEDDGARAAPGTDYFPFVLHRLYEDQYRSVVKRLREHFMHGRRPVTQWSLQLTHARTHTLKLCGLWQ